MPFVQTGQAHGHAFPAELHAAFPLGLAAHVERAGPGQNMAQFPDDIGIDPGTDEHFRAAQPVALSQQGRQHRAAVPAVGCSTAGQHCIHAQSCCGAVGFQRIAGNIDGPVQGDTSTRSRSFHQPVGGVGVQAAVGGQRPYHKAVGTCPAQHRNLGTHQIDFLRGIQKISGTRTHQAPHRNIAFRPDLGQQGGVRGQNAHAQSAAQLQSVGTAGRRGPGRSQAVHTDFQNKLHTRVPSFRKRFWP